MKKEQAKFIKDQFLDRFKGEYKLEDVNDFPIVQKILLLAGLDFNVEVVKNLEKSGSISSGKLADVSVPVYKEKEGGYVLQIGYPEDSEQAVYFDFVNKGVGGVGGKKAKLKKTSGDYKFKNLYVGRAMAANLFQWLNKARKSVRTESITKNTKRISKTQKKNAKLSGMLNASANKKTLAFVIGRSIKRNGIAATYYFDKAVEKTFNQDFVDALREAIAGDITLQLGANGNNNNSGTANG